MTALPSGYRIEQVDASADAVLRNLYEFYLHDMAEWFLFDTTEEGSYQHQTETIWQLGDRVYLLYFDKIPVGFALVGSADEYLNRSGVHDMHDFFVARRHRRLGVGRAFASHLFNAHPGEWLVRVFQGNRPAVPFWRAAISRYAGGPLQEEVRTVTDRPWSYFTFGSTDMATG